MLCLLESWAVHCPNDVHTCGMIRVSRYRSKISSVSVDHTVDICTYIRTCFYIELSQLLETQGARAIISKGKTHIIPSFSCLLSHPMETQGAPALAASKEPKDTHKKLPEDPRFAYLTWTIGKSSTPWRPRNIYGLTRCSGSKSCLS